MHWHWARGSRRRRGERGHAFEATAGPAQPARGWSPNVGAGQARAGYRGAAQCGGRLRPEAGASVRCHPDLTRVAAMPIIPGAHGSRCRTPAAVASTDEGGGCSTAALVPAVLKSARDTLPIALEAISSRLQHARVCKAARYHVDPLPTALTCRTPLQPARRRVDRGPSGAAASRFQRRRPPKPSACRPRRGMSSSVRLAARRWRT